MKKYKVIAKVGSEKFVKYNVNNLLLFTTFLDKSFPFWRWFNVYDSTGNQIDSFTSKSRPQRSKI
jgi:ABC-type uncharacterized transport system permease subunit